MIERRRNRWLQAASWTSAALVVALAGWILADTAIHGAGVLSWEFLTRAPREAGRAGGIGSILVATCWIMGLCLAIALPVALASAIAISELCPRGGRFERFVSASLDALASVPSIVFGLFGNALFCRALGLGFSILAGALTLACMILPILTRSIELGLRSVPDRLRMAGAALGLGQRAVVLRIVVPAARGSIALGVVLGLGRALAETAALIFTSGYVDRFPDSPLDSGRALSVHVLDLAMHVPGGGERAYATALVLLVLVLLVDLALARLLPARTTFRPPHWR